jgi:DNA polymerase-3 subunit beta
MALNSPVSFSMSGKRLSAVLNALSADSAKFEIKNESLLIKSGKSKLKSPIFNADEYPSAPAINTPISSIQCTISQLTSLFNSASYAVAKDDVRNYLSHVNLKIADQVVVVCATDGHRLSQLQHTDVAEPIH